MKYFSLIDSGDVHPSGDHKVIPADEFSELLTAQEIVEKAKLDAEASKKRAKEASKKRRQQGYDDGFEEGLSQLNIHIVHVNNEMKSLRHELQQAVLPLALKAAKKIVGGELKTHPETIVSIVMQAIKPVTQSRHIKIYVNKEDKERLEQEKSRINDILEHVEFLAIEERGDIEPGGCIIETEKGIINASLENQWRALEAAFETFMKKQ